MHKIKQKLHLSLALLLTITTLFGAMASVAHAATLQNTYVRIDRMKASTATTFRVVFKVPSGNSATEAHLKISVPDGFTVATSGLTAATATCATETGATALPGTLSVAGDNTTTQKNIDISGVTDLSATSTYCVDIDKTSTHDPLTNPAAGQYTLTVSTLDSGPTLIDSTDVAARVVSDDQVVVSASVPPAFTFVLDSNTTSFTNTLDSSNVRQTTGRTLTITTNASNGWIAWAKDLNTGLNSATAGHTIASTTPGSGATLSTGSEGYLISGEVTTDAAGGGTVSIPAAYQGTSGNSNGSGLDTTFRQIASSTGTAGGSGDVVTIRGKASVSGSTQAGNDYTDTWTVIGAGTF